MTAADTISGIYAAFGRGDIPSIMKHISPDVSWEHGASDHGIPWLEPGRGLDHVASFFGVVANELAIDRFDVSGIFPSGDQVLVAIDISLEVRSTGKRVRDLELHHWTLGPDGRVIRFRHVVDTHQHWLAMQA